MQLTGTNRSIGLIALIFSVHERRPRSLRDLACFVSLCFAGLVVLARSMNPIPSRTRPLNSSAPMVLWLKPWESRSLPGLPSTRNSSYVSRIRNAASFPEAAFLFVLRTRGCAPAFNVPELVVGELKPYLERFRTRADGRLPNACREFAGGNKERFTSSSSNRNPNPV